MFYGVVCKEVYLVTPLALIEGFKNSFNSLNTRGFSLQPSLLVSGNKIVSDTKLVLKGWKWVVCA